jgi:hypothetical protein
VTSTSVIEQLSRPAEPFRKPEVNAAFGPLLRHVLVAATLLPGHAERYRALRQRWERDGTSDALRADALDAAGDLAAVLQGARREHRFRRMTTRRHDPSHLFGVLAQVFYSFVLLTATDAEAAGLSLEPQELDALLATRNVRDWLDPDSFLRKSFALR